MKTLVQYALRLILFWFVVFILNRIIFYFSVGFLLHDIPFSLVLQSFYHAIRLDLSMLGYLTSLPALLLIVYYLVRKDFLLKIYNGLTIFAILVYNLCAFGECGLYREWKAKLSVQALLHFANPDEVFKTTSFALTVMFFGLMLVFSVLYIFVFKKWIAAKPVLFETQTWITRIWRALATLAIVTFTWVIVIRGGLGGIPIQSSDSYFCTNTTVNDGAVNPLYNLAFDFIHYMYHGKENPFKTMDYEKAIPIVEAMHAVEKDTTEIFLSTKRPNVVFIILESWSANCVKSFGGDDYAPFADSLSRAGIYFSELYPTAYVSDQGIPGILSGFPATSRIAVINQNSKSVHLPCINQDLKKQGYQSGFLFGGDLNYGNIRSYLYNKKWDIVKEEKDYPEELEHGALGIQDRDMAKEYLKLLNTAKAPFVYSWFTLSSHMPYDYKGEKRKLTSIENNYVNSISYTDAVLREFFAEAKKQSWYDNTLFVVCADHSHASHRDYNVALPEYHKIPMFFFGNVIKPEYRGKKVSRILSQLDITPTILHQMDLHEEAKQYVWGKNMFNPYTKQFAVFCSFGTGGYICDKGSITYQYDNPNLISQTTKTKRESDSLTVVAKAYQQMLYKDFMER